MPKLAKVTLDYGAIGLSLRAHPISFIHDQLDAAGAIPAAGLRDERHCPSGRSVAVSGVALVRQRPGTAKGIVFMTIEDETGIANLIIQTDVYAAYRRALHASVAVLVRGRVERRGEVVHVLVCSARSLDGSLRELAIGSQDFR